MNFERQRTQHSVLKLSTVIIAQVLLAIATSLPVTPALASQGPGVLAGTASPFLQSAMAILVYGSSAAVIIAAVIGRARQR